MIKKILIWVLLRRFFWDFTVEKIDDALICRFVNKRLDASLEFYNYYPSPERWSEEIKWVFDSAMRQRIDFRKILS